MTLALAGLLLFGQLGRAAPISWDGGAGAADMNWNTAANWNPDTADVTGGDIVFTNTVVTNAAGTVNNIVSADCSVNSLVYNQLNLYHTTQINAGKTLTVNGGFIAGIPSGNPGAGLFATNTVTFRGDVAGVGTFIINAGANNIVIGPSDTTYGNGRRLNTVDMTNLGTFVASTVGYFYLGSGNDDPANLYLAISNNITASKLTLGGWNCTDTIYLGPTNILNVDQITLGGDVPGGAQVNNGAMAMQFRSGLSSPRVVIRSSSGVGRANMTVGMGGNMNGPNTSVQDLSGGNVDEYLGNFIIGQGYPSGSGGGGGVGTVTVGPGIVDVTNLTVGYVATGTQIQNYGDGTIAIPPSAIVFADVVTLADQQGLATVTGRVNLVGGTLKASLLHQGGGSGTPIFNWSAGTIQDRGPGTNLVISANVPLSLLTVSNHTFYADSGSTIFVYSVISSTGFVVKAGSGDLVFTNVNAYSGGTIISNGTVDVAASGSIASSTSIVVEAGAQLTIENTGNVIGNSAIVNLKSAGASYGKVYLTNGVNESIGYLFLNGIMQTGGTWGATGSGCLYTNDNFFAGAGVLSNSWGSSLLANVPEAVNYTMVYDLMIPATSAWSSSSITYLLDNSANIPRNSFSRIAYYLELVSAGATQWVYVSMTPFIDDASKIGVPNVASGEFYNYTVNGPITNATILSNVGGVTTGTGINTINLEFWPSSYAQTNSYNVPGASISAYDFGDGNAGMGSGYGSMQIHNYGASQTLLAYNNWNGGGIIDIGIGSRGTGDPDWTFAANANTYSIRRLQVLVLSAPTMWVADSDSSWSIGANWTNSIAIGDRAAAYFTNAITANRFVNQDYASLNIANLWFGSPGNFNWAVTNNIINLTNAFSTPIIAVATNTATISCVVTSIQTLTKSGPGTLVLAGSNNFGGMTVRQGGVTVSGVYSNSSAVVDSVGNVAGDSGTLRSRGRGKL